MDTVYIVALLVALTLIITVAVYFYLVGAEEPKPTPRPVAPVPAAKEKEKPQAPAKPQMGKPVLFEIPPNIPRNLATIKIIAQERPDLIVYICKYWLRQGQKGSLLKMLADKTPPPKMPLPKK